MAYLDSFKITKNTGTATSTTLDMPVHASGDFLVAVFWMDGTADDHSTPTSWTPIVNGAGATMSMAAFYFEASSSSTASPVSSHTSSGSSGGCVYVVKDVPSVSPIDTSAAITRTSNSSPNTDVFSPAATTTVNNVLCLVCAVSDNWRHMQLEPGYMSVFEEYNEDGVMGVASAWTFQETAGAVDDFEWWFARGIDDGFSILIPIKSDAGVMPPFLDTSSPPSQAICIGHDGGKLGFTAQDPTAVLTTIDGDSTVYGSSSTVPGAGLNPFRYNQNLTANGGLEVVEYAFDDGPYNLTGKRVVFLTSVYLNPYRIKSLEDNGEIVGLKSGTNEYAIYRAGGIDTSSTVIRPVVIDPDDATYIIQETNTFDVTDVTGFVYGLNFDGASGDARGLIYQVHILNTAVLIAGSSGRPAKISTFFDGVNSGSINTVEKLSDGQFLSYQDLQIGNGSSSLYFEDSNGSLAFPTQASVANKDVRFQDATETIGLEIFAHSSNTVKLMSYTLSSVDRWAFTINASSSASATYDFSGLVIINAAVTLQAIGEVYNGVTFTGCGEVTHNDADLTGATFDGCTDTQAITITGSTQAALQTAINRLDQTEFKNSTTYGLTINFTGTGDVSLNAPDGMTVDKTHYTSTNASGLTIVIGSSGSSYGTRSTGGSATGFEISNNVTITLSVVDESGSAVTGAEIGLLERGTTTEVDHDNNTASGTYTYTYTYTTDVDLDIQVFKEGYATYWNDSATLTDTDQTIGVTLMAVPASQN